MHVDVDGDGDDFEVDGDDVDFEVDSDDHEDDDGHQPTGLTNKPCD